MTIKKLNELTSKLIAENKGDLTVMIDFGSFTEIENANILSVESADVREFEGVDDSGPIGEYFDMLVLSGGQPSPAIAQDGAEGTV